MSFQVENNLFFCFFYMYLLTTLSYYIILYHIVLYCIVRHSNKIKYSFLAVETPLLGETMKEKLQRLSEVELIFFFF